MIALLLGSAAWEWAGLADLYEKKRRILYTALVVGLFLLAVLFKADIETLAFKISALVFWFWILLIPLLVKFPDSKPFFENRLITAVIGVVILLATAMGLLWLSTRPNGAWLVICLITVVGLADSGAFFVGQRWGKNKLAPAISPAKSFEGLYGGLVVNFLFAVVLVLVLHLEPEENFALILVILLTSIASVEGDLLESAIKRTKGVKDSGKILPGHGGVLDRIDGVCAATPCFIFCVLFFSLG